MATPEKENFLNAAGVTYLWKKITAQIETDVAAEAALARAAEQANAKAISDEVTRATAAEQANAKAITDEATARANKIGEIGEVTVKQYVDSAISGVNGDATTLEGRVDDIEDAIDLINGENTGIAAAVKAEADVARAAEKANADAIKALQDLHAEGKSVAQEAADAVAEVVAEAPDAFDTLKEIAEWIQKDGETGFDAANRIVALETKVGETTVAAAVAAEAAVARAAEEANAGAISDLQTLVGASKLESGKNVIARIADLEGLAGTGSVEEQIESALGDLTVTEGAEATVENAIAKAAADAAAAVSAEQTRAEAAESALGGRIDALEGVYPGALADKDIDDAIAAAANK